MLYENEDQQDTCAEENIKISCKTILWEWLTAPNVPKQAWAEMTYAQISQDIWQRYRRKISPASVGIHLPQLAAARHEKSVAAILTIRDRVKRRRRTGRAAPDPEVLQRLEHALKSTSAKVCAAEFGLHYNTILKYRRIFRQQQQDT